MITIKSLVTLTSLVLLLSALPVRAQGCFLSGAALDCNNLNGSVSTFIDFLKKLDERSLYRVKTARFSHNQLSSLPAGLFDQLTNLQYLVLDYNKISSLPAGLFDKLTGLHELGLSHNQLSSLPAGLLDKLARLQEIYVDHNPLKCLGGPVPAKWANLAAFRGLPICATTDSYDSATSLDQRDSHS